MRAALSTILRAKGRALACLVMTAATAASLGPGQAIAAGQAVSTGQAVSSSACRADQLSLRWAGGQARFTVEVVDTVASRNQGLMNREKLAPSAGMLFVYDAPQRASFWMRNTLIPLDMIFMDQTGRVTRIHSNAIPLDETPINGGDGVQFVLEINGGFAKRLGIVEGAEMQHPAVGPTAMWKC